ncbi:hypothetical protein GOODEAATRI_028588 [Goodea atripinnis]|uniref:Uncharacterized protein n=1 Tax=Goodea atripinnis TaxID=208336 RepID=A0ABV0MLJ5_9TELE
MERCVVLLWRWLGGNRSLAWLCRFYLAGMDVGGSASWGRVQPLCCACCGLSVLPFCLLGWCLSLGHGGGRGGASQGLLDCLAGPGVSVRLSVGRACAYAGPELAFGWACILGQAFVVGGLGVKV